MKKYGFYFSLLISLVFVGFLQNINAQNPILEEKLALAARLCQNEIVKELLGQKISPNSRDRFAQPAILLAFRCDLFKNREREEKIWELVKMLTEAGADVNVRNDFGVTPFLLGEIFDFVNTEEAMEAKKNSKPKMTDYLVSKGANPNAKDIYGRNGFQHLHNADTGETLGEQIWRHLIEKSGNLKTETEYQKETAKEKIQAANQFRFGKLKASLAMAAVYYDDLELSKAVGMTLSNIADDVDEEGENIYFYAVRADNPFRFRFLLGRTVFPLGGNISDAQAQEKYRQLNRENLQKRNKNGLTPLELSYQTDSFLFQGFAYEMLKNPNELDKEGLTPLFRAMRSKNFPLIVALLTHENIDANFPANWGATPLIYAAENNEKELVALLLHGIKNPTLEKSEITFKFAAANVNLPDKNGKTALMIAAENGNHDIVKTLLRNGANVFLKDKTGETALSLARKNNRSAIFYRLSAAMKTPNLQAISGTKKIVDASKNPTALMIAAQNGDLAELKRLIKEGTKIDETDADGKPALFYAILSDEIYAAQTLIAAKANVNIVAGGKSTPLMTAARFGRDQMIPLLLKAGAKINEQDKFGKTALVWATETDIETVTEILKGKPNLHLTDKKGETAIVQTVLKGNFNAKEIVAALLKAGANPNDSDANKNNTIRIAAKTKQDNLFVLLLKSGANPYQAGDFGFTTFTELNNYAPDSDENDRIFRLVYENTLPKYRPKQEN
ncbi:MAG TPA: ankyrin repeat domain-containing protein [Pyrinomonadaceae bacterium]|nr:ankyrin repeat domain-containing protein [Pyrinomonadaceae bacterium]